MDQKNVTKENTNQEKIDQRTTTDNENDYGHAEETSKNETEECTQEKKRRKRQQLIQT